MRVLVVDDNENVRKRIARALTADGHGVETVNSILRARTAIREHRPQLLILDLNLPTGSAASFCQELRSQGFTFTILVIAARSNAALRARGLHAGADDYLFKGFTIAELTAAITCVDRIRSGETSPGAGRFEREAWYC